MPVYINPTLASNGTGDFGNPLNTWDGISWAAGETYLQTAGTTFAGASIQPNADNVTVGAYEISPGAQYAKINGDGVTRPIAIGSIAGLTVQDIDVWGGTGNGIIASPASSPKSTGLTLQRLYVHDTLPRVDANDSTAIALFSNAPVLRFLNVERAQDDAIWINSDSGGPLVEFCRVRDVGLRADRFAGDCVQFANWTGTAIIRGCDLENRQDKQAIVGADVNALLIVEDTVAAGGAYVINGNGANLIVRRVYAEALVVAEGAVEESIIYNPTSSRTTLVESSVLNCAGISRNGVFVFSAGASTATLTVRNCTLVDSLMAASNNGLIRMVGSGASANVQNNYLRPDSVGAGTGRAIVTGSGVSSVFKNNRILQEQTSFITLGGTNHSTIVSAQFADPSNRSGNTVGDPLMSLDYVPLPGSPLLSGGADLGYLRDMNGKQSRRHIGAYGTAAFRRNP